MDKYSPPIDRVRELREEELGLLALNYLGDAEARGRNDAFNLNNFLIQVLRHTPEAKPEANEAFTEAWMWLEGERMLAPRRGNLDFFYITKRGKELLGHTNIENYLRGSVLPEMTLDPMLATKVRPTYC